MLFLVVPRHSRFGGTFYVKNFKSISDRDVIYHRAPQDAKQLSFDREKNPKKRAKNRMPMKDTSLIRRSTLSIRLFLKEFCELFLDNCYNPLMHAVKVGPSFCFYLFTVFIFVVCLFVICLLFLIQA